MLHIGGHGGSSGSNATACGCTNLGSGLNVNLITLPFGSLSAGPSGAGGFNRFDGEGGGGGGGLIINGSGSSLEAGHGEGVRTPVNSSSCLPNVTRQGGGGGFGFGAGGGGGSSCRGQGGAGNPGAVLVLWRVLPSFRTAFNKVFSTNGRGAFAMSSSPPNLYSVSDYYLWGNFMNNNAVWIDSEISAHCNTSMTFVFEVFIPNIVETNNCILSFAVQGNGSITINGASTPILTSTDYVSASSTAVNLSSDAVNRFVITYVNDCKNSAMNANLWSSNPAGVAANVMCLERYVYTTAYPVTTIARTTNALVYHVNDVNTFDCLYPSGSPSPPPLPPPPSSPPPPLSTNNTGLFSLEVDGESGVLQMIASSSNSSGEVNFALPSLNETQDFFVVVPVLYTPPNSPKLFRRGKPRDRILILI